ncbi:hypothetical protein [Mesomycoplasma lagogenitalium]|uniref:Uncharacterized protein n=1 Tax=Mesomycoplasma lagogenitalium TaxID=171286 RepID=A0ABY8LV84_9BACT|nr:hypothetical protein [Mesomycoplasma lagogenitalium]WGI36675.1 hypothetical protein QEG99_00095 [Mesomycoplasma lagogenitalium]
MNNNNNNNNLKLKNYFHDLQIEKDEGIFKNNKIFKESEFYKKTKIASFLKFIKIKSPYLLILFIFTSFHWTLFPLFYSKTNSQLLIVWIAFTSIFTFVYIFLIFLIIWKWIYSIFVLRINKLKLDLVDINKIINKLYEVNFNDFNLKIKEINIVSKAQIQESFLENTEIKSQYFLEVITKDRKTLYWDYFSLTNNNLLFYSYDHKTISYLNLDKNIDIFNYEIISKNFKRKKVFDQLIDLFLEKIKLLNDQL